MTIGFQKIPFLVSSDKEKLIMELILLFVLCVGLIAVIVTLMFKISLEGFNINQKIRENPDITMSKTTLIDLINDSFNKIDRYMYPMIICTIFLGMIIFYVVDKEIVPDESIDPTTFENVTTISVYDKNGREILNPDTEIRNLVNRDGELMIFVEYEIPTDTNQQ